MDFRKIDSDPFALSSGQICRRVRFRVTAQRQFVITSYSIHYTKLYDVQVIPGPNYSAHQGTIRVYKDGAEVAVLKPQKRTYLVQTKPMTEAGIVV